MRILNREFKAKINKKTHIIEYGKEVNPENRKIEQLPTDIGVIEEVSRKMIMASIYVDKCNSRVRAIKNRLHPDGRPFIINIKSIIQ